MANYNLNFSLTTDLQRTQYIASICTTTFTQKQLTQMADYILLGANTTSTSCIIYPEEFSSPHIIHNEQSLDELMEDDVLSDIIENQAQPISRSVYKKTLRKIDRNNPIHSSIPGMAELWATIDYYKNLYSTSQNYKVHNLLISLYKQQYSLLESYFPVKSPIVHENRTKQYLPWYTGVPLQNGDYADLDLTLPAHMSKFLIHLPCLKEYCTDLDCDLAQLLADVDKALSMLTLTPLQWDVLHLYQCGKSIREMQAYIAEKHNRKIGQAYFSVILYNQIAPKVCTEYAEIYNSRIWAKDPTKWRICLRCKEKKLLTKHNFHHYSNKPNGYALVCKECTKKAKEIKAKGGS